MFRLGESQFQIIAKSGSVLEKICLTAMNNEINKALIKTPCSSQDAHDPTQLFKWKSGSDQLVHAASDLCITGATKRFGNVSNLAYVMLLTGLYAFIMLLYWEMSNRYHIAKVLTFFFKSCFQRYKLCLLSLLPFVHTH